MTRINSIPVEELTNPHLLAEYRELPRVFALARPCLDAPQAYILGTGHVKFFYNKLLYLYHRQIQIVCEMKRRGMKPAFEPETLEAYRQGREDLWNDWVPTQDAMRLNRERIETRLRESLARRRKETS